MNNKEQFLRLPEVIERTGRSRSSIYGDSKEGKFPSPIKIGPRAVAWPLSAITAWQQSCIDASKF